MPIMPKMVLLILIFPMLAQAAPTAQPAAAPRAAKSGRPPRPPRVALPPLLIESLDGPVSEKEIAAFVAYMQKAPASTDNVGNDWVYGSSGSNLEAMCLVYEVSHDAALMDRMIIFADTALACRNDPQTGRVLWTGKRELCWPNKADDKSPGAGYSGSENGDVLAHIGYCARLILESKELWEKPVAIGDPHHFGATYLARAKTYITECDKTIDTYILPYFVKKESLRFYLPSDERWKTLDARTAKSLDKPIPWNQQMMLAGGFQRLAECHELLGDDPARVAKYDAVVKASMDWFMSQMVKHTVGGHECYKWSYAVDDKVLHYVEDGGHAGYDITGICRAYRRGKYGITKEQMMPFVNAVRFVIAQPDGKFAWQVDGNLTKKPPRSNLGGTWLELGAISPEYYQLVAKAGLERAKTSPDAVARILWLRAMKTKANTK